ncbi:MAG TPA: hypothetical protein VLY04_06130 [Bryobacteraceae bacterium]|nr:hypothetical protein [Bryobacteraceae bacterium]
MTAVFVAVLLCSFAIQRLFSPIGDAALRALDSRQVSVTGVIAASQSEPGKIALDDGGSRYVLADQIHAGMFAGRKVRVIGIFHESTGLLEVRSISPLPL